MIRQNRRGQAALEYLFTYGWAFMVIIITLGALMYFGFFDFDRLRGSDCVFPAGALCDEFYVGPGVQGSGNPYEVRVILRNTYGVPIVFSDMEASYRFGLDVACTRGANSDSGSGAVAGSVWERDALIEFVCELDASTYIRGQRYEITFTGDFTQQGHTYVHELIGWISTNAQ